jgi:hypothetical protein
MIGNFVSVNNSKLFTFLLLIVVCESFNLNMKSGDLKSIISIQDQQVICLEAILDCPVN